jgi:ABC-type antimicrobial peptide transport system permease subunit
LFPDDASARPDGSPGRHLRQYIPPIPLSVFSLEISQRAASVAELLAHSTGWETVISPLVMVVAVGFSSGVGVFFGQYPARKAATLHPIEALRYQ